MDLRYQSYATLLTDVGSNHERDMPSHLSDHAVVGKILGAPSVLLQI